MREYGIKITSTNNYENKWVGEVDGVRCTSLYHYELENNFYFLDHDGTFYVIDGGLTCDYLSPAAFGKWYVPQGYWKPVHYKKNVVETLQGFSDGIVMDNPKVAEDFKKTVPEADYWNKADKIPVEMTLREWVCYELKIPNSGLLWLDDIIKQYNVTNKVSK